MSRMTPNVLGRWSLDAFHLPSASGRGGRSRQGRKGFGRGVCTILAPLACVLLLVFAGVASAQTPSPDATLRAFRIAEKHIREWRLPPDPSPKGPENSEVPKAVGACITLKLRGEVVGRGAAWSDAIAGPGAFSGDVLRRAILSAMQQADPKLGVPNDAMRDAAIKLVTPDILISVELAGPLSVVEFNTWEDAEMMLRPGLDGVAARIGGEAGGKQGTLHAIFPSQMMLGNMLPHRAMGAVASKAIGEGGAAAALDDPKKLRESSGVRMYRFRVGQAVQGTSSAAPSVLFRGAALWASPPTRAELESFAAQMAAHLGHRTKPGSDPKEPRFLATIRPGSEPDATVVPALNLLIAGYAVEQYRDLRGDKELRWDESDAARFVQAAQVAGRSAEPGTPAMFWLAGNSVVDLRKSRSLIRPRARAAIEEAAFGLAIDGPPHDPDDPFFKCVNPSVVSPEFRSMLVMAASTLNNAPRTGYAKKTDEILRSVYKDMPPSQLVGALPWLGWAEIARTRLAWLEDEPTDIPGAIALRRIREDCWKHQLSITDATEDTLDMTGGIIFTAGNGKGGGNPYPTWQCVRPLAFIATMLRDPRLTEPNERPEQIVRLMQAARFLRQLQVDEASAWMYPDPKLAIGGIRASTWDNSLPVDATSMTLLFVVELIKSLDALSAAQQPPTIAPVAPGGDAPKPK